MKALMILTLLTCSVVAQQPEQTNNRETEKEKPTEQNAQQDQKAPKPEACIVVKCGGWYSDKKCGELREAIYKVWESKKHAKRSARSEGWPLKGGKFEHLFSTFDTGKKRYSLNELDLLHSAGTRILILTPKHSGAELDKAVEECKLP